MIAFHAFAAGWVHESTRSTRSSDEPARSVLARRDGCILNLASTMQCTPLGDAVKITPLASPTLIGIHAADRYTDLPKERAGSSDARSPALMLHALEFVVLSELARSFRAWVAT